LLSVEAFGQNGMFDMTSKILTAAALALGLMTTAAYADSCSGRSHPEGTVLGAVGGGLIGSQVAPGAGGIIGGAVVGGLAGNAVARGIDCRHGHRYYRHSRYYRRHYEGDGYQDSHYHD
jgi:hypothetical protein